MQTNGSRYSPCEMNRRTGDENSYTVFNRVALLYSEVVLCITYIALITSQPIHSFSAV